MYYLQYLWCLIASFHQLYGFLWILGYGFRRRNLQSGFLWFVKILLSSLLDQQSLDFLKVKYFRYKNLYLEIFLFTSEESLVEALVLATESSSVPCHITNNIIWYMIWYNALPTSSLVFSSISAIAMVSTGPSHGDGAI